MRPTVSSSEIVHENPWYEIRHDVLTWPNGKPGNYFVAEFPGASCVICIDQNRILTVKQYRYAIDQDTIELPMGSLRKDETPLEAAQRELQEETGMTAASWKSLGHVFSLNGACKMPLHIFIAQNISKNNTKLDDSEHDLQSQWTPIPEWEEMIRQGKIVDVESLAPWLLYLRHTGEEAVM